MFDGVSSLLPYINMFLSRVASTEFLSLYKMMARSGISQTSLNTQGSLFRNVAAEGMI
jgi:hypothetical protein